MRLWTSFSRSALLSSVFSAPIAGECKRFAKNRSRATQMAFICKPLNRRPVPTVVRRLKLEIDLSRVSKASTDFERTSNRLTVSPSAAIGSSSPNSLRFVKGARLAAVPEEVATIVIAAEAKRW
jgi:hypothetical protein